MTSKKIIIFSIVAAVLALVLVVILVLNVYCSKSVFELLDFVMESPDEHLFLQYIKQKNVHYIIVTESGGKKIFVSSVFKRSHGAIEYQKKGIASWYLVDKRIRIPAFPDVDAKKIIKERKTPIEIINVLGFPSVAQFENNQLMLTYFLLRDNRACRPDGQYNSSITFCFDKQQIKSYFFSIISDLEEKDIYEIFL